MEEISNQLTARELEAYKLIFQQNLKDAEVSRRLKAKGIDMSPMQVGTFHKTIFDKMLLEERKESMSKLMFESFSRLKFEFEDIVTRTKKYLDKFEAEGDVWKAVHMQDKLQEQITLALKVMGRLDKMSMNIQAKNVNILNPSALAEAFQTALTTWFDIMDVTYENGKLVFNKPSPELVDDFNKWRAKQLREAVKVDVEQRTASRP